MPFRGRDRTVDRALEFRTVGKTGEVVGARLLGVLTGAVERDRDLVRHRRDELQVAGFEGARQPGRDGHRPEQHTLGPQLGADGAPLAGDPVHARLGRAG